MVVNLIVVGGRTSKKQIALRRPRTVVGRKKGCKVRIQSDAVSRIHCALEIRDDRLTVKDLGSSNGTFVNGRKVKQQVLEAGDTLTIGPIKFHVQINGVPSADERAAQGGAKPSIAMTQDDDEIIFFETDDSAAPQDADEPSDADAIEQMPTTKSKLKSDSDDKNQPIPADENIFVQDDEPALAADEFEFPDSVLDEGGYKLADGSHGDRVKDA